MGAATEAPSFGECVHAGGYSKDREHISHRSPGSEPSVPPPLLYPHVYAAEKSIPEAYQKQPTKS